MRPPRIIFQLVWVAAFLWGGCNPRQASGPNNMPVFALSPQPAQIDAGHPEAQMFLVALFPNEFAQLQGQQVFFSSSSAQGAFNSDSTAIDVNSASESNLRDAIWYLHAPTGGENTQDTLYAHCLAFNRDTLSWDSCTIEILGAP